MTRDLYEVLDVPGDASAADIKKACRRAARSAHPDAGGSAEAFHELETAYSVLSDEARRARYDATGQINDKADNSHAAALQVLHKFVSAFLEEDDIHTKDMVAFIRASVQKNLDKMAENEEGGREHLKDVVGCIGRLSGKDSAIIVSMLEGRRRDIETALAQIADTRATFEKVLTMIADANFKFDEPPPRVNFWDIPPPPFASSSTTNPWR